MRIILSNSHIYLSLLFPLPMPTHIPSDRVESHAGYVAVSEPPPPPWQCNRPPLAGHLVRGSALMMWCWWKAELPASSILVLVPIDCFHRHNSVSAWNGLHNHIFSCFQLSCLKDQETRYPFRTHLFIEPCYEKLLVFGEWHKHQLSTFSSITCSLLLIIVRAGGHSTGHYSCHHLVKTKALCTRPQKLLWLKEDIIWDRGPIVLVPVSVRYSSVKS